MSAFFSLDQVLAYTESATSEYSTTSQCLSVLLGRSGRVKFILNDFRWKKTHRNYHSYTTTAWRLSTLIYNAATRGGNGSQPRGGGVTGPQGHIPHKKKPRRRKPPCRGPKSPPWWTTVLNLEFKPWPFVIGAPSSHVRHFVVFLSRGFFLPEISAQPPSGAGLRAEWGW